MKKYIKIPVPASERQHLEKLICDICKKETESGWRNGCFDTTDTTIEYKTGSYYGHYEGGSEEKIEFDICPECFMNKLIPALKNLGAEPTITERDW